MDITIRAAHPGELESVGELTAQAYLRDGLLATGADDPYLAVLRDARRRAEHSEMLVATDATTGEVLGTVSFVGDGGEYADIAGPGEAEFRMLAVRPEGRGRGVGEALVQECVARARQRGMRRVVLSSQRGMAAAHRLYGRLGFRRTPGRDWQPIPGFTLLTFALELSG